MVDSKEPKSIQELKFIVPSVITNLEMGDLWATTNQGHILIIERKTPEDLLGSIKDDRLFTQAGAMADKRIKESIYFPYLIISKPIEYDHQGKVITDRGATGWNYDAVMGALLTVQEMGVPVIFSREGDYAGLVVRLGERNRDPETSVPPPRPPRLLGHGSAILMSLPGIGPEMLNRIWEEADGIVAQALWRLTCLNVRSSVPDSTRKKIRKALGLEKLQELGLAYSPEGKIYLALIDQEKESEKWVKN
jgi:ERCC4-type nuclease